MIPLTPALLVGAAQAFIGLGEEGGDNRGPMVELMLREVHQPAGQPWCAAFVHHVGWWSHYDQLTKKSSWPLPATASCYELGEFARKNEILQRFPRFGDVFLSYSATLKRFYHTGIIVEIIETIPFGEADFMVSALTVEGNTNDDGSPNGYTTLRRLRRFNTHVGDGFINWPELDQRQQAA